MPPKARKKNKGQPSLIEAANGNGVVALIKELWEAAVTLRGSIEPADGDPFNDFPNRLAHLRLDTSQNKIVPSLATC